MTNRRTLLLALAATFAGLLGARPAAEARPAPSILRYGEFYVVDGWVLTRSDLQSLGLDAR